MLLMSCLLVLNDVMLVDVIDVILIYMLLLSCILILIAVILISVIDVILKYVIDVFLVC